MRDLAQALRDFVLLFESMGIPYAITGGIAVRIYGIPRRNRLPELRNQRQWLRMMY